METSVLISLKELQALLDAASKVPELEKSIVQLILKPLSGSMGFSRSFNVNVVRQYTGYQ